MSGNRHIYDELDEAAVIALDLTYCYQSLVGFLSNEQSSIMPNLHALARVFSHKVRDPGKLEASDPFDRVDIPAKFVIILPRLGRNIVASCHALGNGREKLLAGRVVGAMLVEPIRPGDYRTFFSSTIFLV